MSQLDKFGINESSYERPRCKFRCGRSLLWKRSCWQGPDEKGQCGGIHDCAPVKKEDRYYCTRPARVGGACQQGPLPDGQCAMKRPACSPVSSLRSIRRQVTIITVIILISVMGLMVGLGHRTKIIEPGDLTLIHAAYTEEKGCTSCHTPHDKNLSSWLMSAFSKNDISNNCLDCHGFNEPQLSAHNFDFANPEKAKQLTPECSVCHNEHKGSDFDITAVESGTCNNCHEKTFAAFEKGHPDFPEKFPSSVPNSIQFNHTKHIKEYFSEPKWLDKPDRDKEFALKAGQDCTTCHAIETVAENRIKPKTFEEICTGCHQQQVQGRSLTLLRPDEYTPLSALLLNVTEEDEDEDLYIELLTSLAEAPDDALYELLESFGAEKDFSKLFSGLNPLLIKTSAENWLEEEDFESELNEDIPHYGWLSGYNEDGDQALRYKAAAHADPIMKDWFEFILRNQNSEALEDLDEEILTRVKDDLFDTKTGAGACAKCHAAGLLDQTLNESGLPEWSYRGQSDRKFTHFSHGPHINLLNPSENCSNCHKINETANYAAYFDAESRQAIDFISNFSSISIGGCQDCHRAGKVNSACTQCHNYHYKPVNKQVFGNKQILSSKEPAPTGRE